MKGNRQPRSSMLMAKRGALLLHRKYIVNNSSLLVTQYHGPPKSVILLRLAFLRAAGILSRKIGPRQNKSNAKKLLQYLKTDSLSQHCVQSRSVMGKGSRARGYVFAALLVLFYFQCISESLNKLVLLKWHKILSSVNCMNSERIFNFINCLIQGINEFVRLQAFRLTRFI